MANLNDFAKRFRIGLSTASPFTSMGLEWCPRCKMEVDTDTESVHEGTTYAFRRQCLRCGRTVKRGIYNNVPLLSNTPLPAAALEWTTQPGQDRR